MLCIIYAIIFSLVCLQKLGPLKIRSHGACMHDHGGLPYDERYTKYIDALGLLPFFSLVTRSTTYLNASALTALADRWRPETHSFHLPTGEMTITLQDVSMILGLPIDGEPVCISTDSDGWREKMAALCLGRAPEPPPENSKERVPAGATYVWIVQNFSHCPIPADEDTEKAYARVYVWYVLSRTLFADGGGRTAQWFWLKQLTFMEKRFSWGTAALAYLYRQVITCRL